MRVVCTTPWNQTPVALERATRVAEWFGCPLVLRRGRSIRELMKAEGVEAVIVAEPNPVLYHAADPDHQLFFHPGMARTRLAALRRGRPDRLLSMAEVRLGDHVLDATLGLGSDSLVFAYAVGDEGVVTATEASWWLGRMFMYAQAHPETVHKQVRPLLGRVRVTVEHHLDYLRRLPDDSVDVVYFDPMFRQPITQSSQVDPLRVWANPEPLSAEAVQEAKRVARRCVIVKERVQSGEFDRLGLEPDKRSGRFAYGVWRKR